MKYDSDATMVYDIPSVPEISPPKTSTAKTGDDLDDPQADLDIEQVHRKLYELLHLS